MAWFEDLSPCDYFGPNLPSLRAIGWLERGRPYPVGRASAEVFTRLVDLLKSPWQPAFATAAGVHPCDLCLYEPQAFHSATLFVPGQGVIYACPALVTHTMNAHGYAPPAEFCRAVLNCPRIASMAYFEALLGSGGRVLLRLAET